MHFAFKIKMITLLFNLIIKVNTYITGNVPGSPGCDDGNGIITQVITLLLGIFMCLLVHFLYTNKIIPEMLGI